MTNLIRSIAVLFLIPALAQSDPRECNNAEKEELLSTYRNFLVSARTGDMSLVKQHLVEERRSEIDDFIGRPWNQGKKFTMTYVMAARIEEDTANDKRKVIEMVCDISNNISRIFTIYILPAEGPTNQSKTPEIGYAFVMFSKGSAGNWLIKNNAESRSTGQNHLSSWLHESTWSIQ